MSHLTQAFWFERLPQPGLSGGSVFKAYIRARSQHIEENRGNNWRSIRAGLQPWNCRLAYLPLAGPKGFLP